jgi:ribonuclease D
MEGRSFSSLVYKELGIKLDKKEQTSNWSKRPLVLNQLIYASNDVIYLLKLKEMILNTKITSEVIGFVKEENLILEASSTKDFTPKLSPDQICKFSEHQRLKLLELKVIRDKFAKEFNMPPSNLVADTFLEAIILDPYRFIKESFRFGFSKKAKASTKFTTEFSKIIYTIEVEKSAVIPNEKKRESTKSMEEKSIIIERRNLRLNSFKDYVNKKYGIIAGILILEGLSKRFCSAEINWVGAKNYQRSLYQKFIETIKQC